MSGETGGGWPRGSQSPESTPADLAALRDSAGSLARDPLAVPGLLVAVGGLALGGPAGLAAGATVVTLWATAAPLYAATAVALFGAVVAPGGPGQVAVAGGVGGLLLALAARSDRRWHALLATGLAGLATGSLVAAGIRAGDTTLAAVGLVAALGMAGYGVHRYSLVRTAHGGSR